MTVDVLAVGAHSDDVELGIGALIHKMAQAGHSVAILDLSRAELSTRGNPEERAKEAARAAEILGVKHRVCAGLPDGGIANTDEQRRAVIPFLREYRPRILLTTMAPDRHPDHTAAHALVRDANFAAGVRRIETGQAPHRAESLFFFHPYYDSETPQLVVDVSGHAEAKLEALRAYASQFYNPEHPGEETLIASKSFWDGITARLAYWGARAKVTHGEPLYAESPLPMDLPPGL